MGKAFHWANLGLLSRCSDEGSRLPMAEILQSLTELLQHLGRLPGIGKKTAERLAYHILRVHVSEAIALSDAIRKVRENVR